MMPEKISMLPQMQIGEFVRKYVPDIFRYCDAHPSELAQLRNRDYCNEIFGLQWPFCLERHEIFPKDWDAPSRFWKGQEYYCFDKRMYVCSQWYEYHFHQFCRYLRRLGIEPEPVVIVRRKT